MVNSTDSHTPPVLTHDQYNQLMNLLQERNQNRVSENEQGVGGEHAVLSAQFSDASARMTGNDAFKNSNTWILDSGASDHVCCSLHLFDSFHPILSTSVKLPDNTLAKVTHIGTITINPNLIISGVFYIPSFTFNLLSLSKLTSSKDCLITFRSDHCIIQDMTTKKMIGSAEAYQGLYHLHGSFKAPSHTLKSSTSARTSPTFGTTLAASVSGSLLWHARLGHLGISRLKEIQRLDPQITVPDESCKCSICPLAKQKCLPFPISDSVSKKLFSLVHMDIWGPYKHPTMYHQYYFLTVVDDYSRYCWIYLMQSKSQTRNIIHSFYQYVLVQFDTSIKVIRTDNGSEFSMNSFYASKDIIHQTSCVNTPQQNGIVERKQQHILSVARALKFQAYLPVEYWGFCVQHATYLINLIPSPILHHNSPFKLLYKSNPVYSNLKVFGCLAFATNNQAHKEKFAPRARRSMFLGLSYTTKGYVLQDLATKNIFYIKGCDIS